MRALRVITAATMLAGAALVVPVVSVGATPHTVAPTVREVPMPAARASSAFGATTGVESRLTRATDGTDVVGVAFPDRAAASGVTVTVRSRQHGAWGPWTELGLTDSAPDAGTPESGVAAVATEPIGVTGTDAVQVRVHSTRSSARLDRLRATFVDGGTSAADGTIGATPSATAGAAVTKPVIITRAEWGADESLRRCSPTYLSSIKGAVVHHTVNSNTYSADSVPAMLRGIYAYHVTSNGWCDIGYNFLTDRFGRLFEGRYGGVSRNVLGAQAGGFNSQTFGVSSLGNHDPSSSGAVAPTSAELKTIAGLIAWKASLNGWDPSTSTSFTSAGNSKYPAGTVITLPRVSGHRNFNLTSCPGDLMYEQLSAIRSAASATYRAGQVTATTMAPSPVVETYGRPSGTSFSLSGRGWGHGRGMSQYGAYGAALSGLGRDQILGFYYPGTTVAATMGNPAMRVRLTALGSTSTQVVYRSGLTVSDGSRTVSLAESNADGSARSRWRVVAGGAGLTLQWWESGAWRSKSGWTALATPVEFKNSTSSVVRVVLPDGTSRDYRRTIRSVRAGSGVMTVNVLSMDHYLRGVVPLEMSASWPGAALQAQAVAARSFAYHAKAHQVSGSPFDTCDSTACQAYKGVRSYSASGTVTTTEQPATTDAVLATSGVAVYYAGAVALTQFSAANGGQTVKSSLPYQVSKADPYDAIPAGSPSRWTTTLSVAKVESAYPGTGSLLGLRITSRDGISAWGGRTTSVTILGSSGSTTVSGDAFRSAMGLRSTWWTVTSAPRISSAAYPKDLTGDTLADLLAVDPGGYLKILSGTGAQGFTARTVGGGWGGLGLVSNVGAWDGDNRHDVTARIKGTLYYYPGNGKGGFYPRVAISTGWDGVDLLTGPGDVDGDGHTDLLSRTSATGQLTLHRGNGKGGIAGSVAVGPGWNAFRVIAAAGDLSGDGRPDVVALRATDNAMLLYRGTGLGGFSTPTTITGTWNGYSAVIGAGDLTGDSRHDLVARRTTDGALVILTGNDSGSLTTGTLAAGTPTWTTWTRWTP